MHHIVCSFLLHLHFIFYVIKIEIARLKFPAIFLVISDVIAYDHLWNNSETFCLWPKSNILGVPFLE